MRKVTFTIIGTHEGPSCNPLPKLKMTGKQSWTPKAQKYARYKEFVRAKYLDAVLPNKLIKREDFGDVHDILGEKPIRLAKDAKARMDIKIEWASKAHGDPENIFGAIADALFENDKHLAGSFDFSYAHEKKAKVSATIYFEE